MKDISFMQESSGARPAVFLDRDGTIVEDRGDLSRPEQVHFLPGAFAALRSLADKFPLFLVTNQGGVAAGGLTIEQVDRVNQFIVECLREQGIELADIYVCPHAVEDNCRCRKPSPWFLRQAADRYGLDLSRSFMVGDHPHDGLTGSAVGATGIMLLSGHGLRHRHEVDGQSLMVLADIVEAAQVILDEHATGSAEDDEVGRAARHLRRGGLVAFPTETVYGLAANAYDQAAVGRIFAVKQRPKFNPLIVHIPDISWFDRLARAVPASARRLARAFWPGPLTLVLPRRECISDLVVAGLETVALRVPDHRLALNLLNRTGIPLAAPSANRFAGISPTCADHVRDGLPKGVAMVIDGGPCRVGVESTIVGFAGEQPVLLRAGGIGAEQVGEVAGIPVVEPASVWADRQPVLAPGMMRRHYAPSKPLFLFEPDTRLPSPPPEQAALLLTKPRDDSEVAAFSVVETLSRTGDQAEIARNLFAALRRLEQSSASLIFAELTLDCGLGAAINDRLRRAAAEA